MINATPFAVIAVLALFLVVGFFFGMDWQCYRDRNLRTKLEVAEATLVEMTMRVDRLQAYKDDVMKEFAEGRWEAV